MTVAQVQEIVEGKLVTDVGDLSTEVSSGFVGDLLSVVMGKAEEDCAWITIQGHLNIVGVGSLIGVSCIIVTEGFKVDDEAREKANEEEIVILETAMSSFEAASVLAKAGLS